MTVPIQVPVSTHVGNGVTTGFAYQFLIGRAADLEVRVAGVLKVIDIDYTLTGIGNPVGGNVNMLAAPANLATIVLARAIKLERTTDYQYAGDFQATTVNPDFDRIWMALQDSKYLSSLAVLLPTGDTAAPMTLPSVAARANAFLAFDALGRAVAAAGVTGLPTNAFIAPFLLAATAAAARAVIGAQVAGNYAASGANSDITSLTGLTTPLSAAQGGAQQILSLPNPTLAASAMTLPAATLTQAFRNATASDGTIGAAITGTVAALVIPSGATLGTVNAVASSILEVVMNNAGTMERAVINLAGGNDLSETGFISTTAITAGATSASVFYSNTARTALPYRVVRRIDSTQATAGTWVTTPSLVQGVGGQALTAMSSFGHGQTWQNVTGSRALGTTYYNTTGKPIDVYVEGLVTGGNRVNITVSGLNFGSVLAYTSSNATLQISIPVGAAYSATASGGGSLVLWQEQR